ncbi:hypothetical protein KCP71_07230 [Salmonella enterica subsp. enterica]|nr:hypothetical protein KCP71_07230 [Salmonella enterica subsp. enterica]
MIHKLKGYSYPCGRAFWRQPMVRDVPDNQRLIAAHMYLCVLMALTLSGLTRHHSVGWINYNNASLCWSRYPLRRSDVPF